MKQTLTLILAFFVTNSFGQKITGDKTRVVIKGSEKVGTTLEVHYGERFLKNPDVEFYLDNKRIDESLVSTIPRDVLDSIHVAPGNKMFFYSINRNYNPRIISLNALKQKYTKLSDSTVVFFVIDNQIVNEDYRKFLVDENNLLRIIIDPMYRANKADVTMISVFTKTKENIEKFCTLRIR
ncbi:hypothetical protein [Pinibacter soli]|uniref:Uncharacterized protein n=1 Tax=Pinibacter soli TaxID=3044211 RepID=A0ABT6R7E3_9BACT|nr:hypothetical protein [Pinibacter soli]MDI3318487.1 hypothetical protein [Pinibacter soli]